MTIEEMKQKRDGLHDQLHALLAEYKPVEEAIRKEIGELQETLYNLEMKPVFTLLKGKETLTNHETQKLALLNTKFGN